MGSSSVALTILHRGPESIDSVFKSTQVPIHPKRWQAIVIHHSGQPFGNQETIGHQHQAEGKGGLTYHFVLGNGDQAEDGEIQMGYRWNLQINGYHGESENAKWLDRNAIDICLVGDGNMTAPTELQMRQLVKLVTALQKELNIPAESVFLNSAITSSSSPGRFFPSSEFRSQLLQDIN